MTGLRRVALGAFLLAVAFFVFFSAAKHRWGDVNPFAADPYDGVGSFGIQLALFASLLAVLRASRTGDTPDGPARRASLVIRAASVSVIAVAASLLADAVAIARFPGIWAGSSRGWALTALTAAMAALTGFVCWRLLRLAAAPGSTRSARPGRSMAGTALVAIAILAVYPSGWRAGIAGAVLTAAVGMVWLFVVARAAAAALFPGPPPEGEGAFDDIGAVIGDVQARVPALAPLLAPARAVATWLAPGGRRWRLVFAVAATTGIALVLVEWLGEGPPSDRRLAVLLVTVILAIEGTGVLVGYLLLGGVLGIFRRGDPS